MKKLALIGTVALGVVGAVIFEKGVFTLPTSASGAIAFQDVPSDYWAKDAIQTAVDNGYVVGKSEGIFDPESSVTRAEFIKMIVTAEKLPVTGETTGNDWYGPYVNAAVQNGIHVWSDFTSGDWNTPLTRAELARLAVRGTVTDNTDDKKWLYLAAKAGLIQGMDNTGTLAEDGTTTRAQSVTIIERILAVKRGETLPADKHAVSRAEVAWHGTNIFTMWPRYFSTKIDQFDLSKFQWDSSDGIYHEEVMYYVVVDIEDPNDPFRAEIEGMPFPFSKYNESGFVVSGVMQQAPTKSYVTYSKVKQVITGQYPASLWTTGGGRVYVDNLIPKDVDTKKSIWKKQYADQESENDIYFTKESIGQPAADWNTQQRYNPFYVKNLPSTGGTYYWISAQVHPKGEYYPYSNYQIVMKYVPNIEYMKTYGPNYNPQFWSNPDYSQHNE